MKYAELHVHLEGCLWEKHFHKYADHRIYQFPSVSFDPQKRPLSFDEFLAVIRHGYNYLCGTDQYVSVLNDYLDAMHKQGIVYAEIQINLALLKSFHIDVKSLLHRFNQEIRKRERMTVRFIVDLPWQFSAVLFQDILMDFEPYQALGVVGLSMGGDESYARPLEIGRVFKQARLIGYKLLCHAGETTGFQFARKLVEELAPDRIGHGLSIADWLLHIDRVTIVDTCLSSNFQLGLVDDLNNHPFKKWLTGDKVIATLSTDDPAIFNTTLVNELDLASRCFENFSGFFENYEKHLLAAAFDQEAIYKALYPIS